MMTVLEQLAKMWYFSHGYGPESMCHQTFGYLC